MACRDQIAAVSMSLASDIEIQTTVLTNTTTD